MLEIHPPSHVDKRNSTRKIVPCASLPSSPLCVCVWSVESISPFLTLLPLLAAYDTETHIDVAIKVVRTNY